MFTLTLTVSQLTRGLFERVIIMFGSLFAPWAISHYPKDAAEAVGHLLGCRPGVDKELFECLRSRDVKDIVQAFSRHQKNLNTTKLFDPAVESYLWLERAFVFKSPQWT